jgi:8-oxo-dGTP diphosphatase
VQGLLVREGLVLVGRRRLEPRKGHWDLPGGFLEEGEEPLVGLRREFLEETGIEVEPVEWLGAAVDPYDAAFVLGLTWIVRGDGEPRAADDIEELRFVGPDELPEEMAFASQSTMLALWVEKERRADEERAAKDRAAKDR